MFSAYKPSEMVQWLGSFKWEEAALVLSGDTGFYSGAEAARQGIYAGRDGMWNIVPGVSSLSYFCARLGRAGRMCIRSAAMEGTVMWWPI
ncbi:MAG: hypothetical protein ACLTW9_00330 [Enterocloster sp.]